ncbi:MAG: hypothetical protein V1800_04140 [Candidatus Latescibacterota bacterium]
MADLAGKIKVLIGGREDGKTVLDRLLPHKSNDQHDLHVEDYLVPTQRVGTRWNYL